MIRALLLAALLLVVCSGDAFAASGVIIVNNNCSASPTPAPATGQQVTYVDQNGALCQNSSGGGGGGNVTITAPLGQSAAAASVAVVGNTGSVAGQQANAAACGSSVAINQTASTDILTSTNKIHICAIILVSAIQQGISLSEGTGTVCASGTALLMGGAGGTMQVAANGGFAQAAPFPFMITKTAADHLCLLQSGSGNVSGIITYSDNAN